MKVNVVWVVDTIGRECIGNIFANTKKGNKLLEKELAYYRAMPRHNAYVREYSLMGFEKDKQKKEASNVANME